MANRLAGRTVLCKSTVPPLIITLMSQSESHTPVFTEPQTITVNAVADNLPRVSFSPKGVFTNTSTGRSLSITQILGKRNRRTVRFDITKTAADPLLDGVSRQYSMSAYLVIDHPQVGFTDAEVAHNARALVDWADTAGALEKVIGGES